MIAVYIFFRIVDPGCLDQLWYLLYGKLMSEEVEIDPCFCASSFLATQEFSVKSFDAFQISGSEGEVETALQWHFGGDMVPR